MQQPDVGERHVKLQRMALSHMQLHIETPMEMTVTREGAMRCWRSMAPPHTMFISVGGPMCNRPVWGSTIVWRPVPRNNLHGCRHAHHHVVHFVVFDMAGRHATHAMRGREGRGALHRGTCHAEHHVYLFVALFVVLCHEF